MLIKLFDWETQSTKKKGLKNKTFKEDWKENFKDIFEIKAFSKKENTNHVEKELQCPYVS